MAMPIHTLTVCFARRGYSETGGAERYLRRLAEGVQAHGYRTRLFASEDWPENDPAFGQVIRLGAKSPLAFANELGKLRENSRDEVLISLERVCRCDVYRAGDGVHQAWLNRRERFEMPWRKWIRKVKRKHRDLVHLEETLLQERGADRVITNSRMVKNEIVDLFNYRPDRIEVVHNGIPLDQFGYDAALRTKSRTDLGLTAEDIVLLFAGTGWERKGLRYAIAAMETCEDTKLLLLVAGRGGHAHLQRDRVRFLGEVPDLRPVYAAADIFILPTIYDPFSNACLEALACGLPIITTRANGFSEVMEDRIHGSIVDQPDDIDDLRNAIQAWSDPTRRQVARPSILKRAAQFDISRNVQRTLEIVLQSAARAASMWG
jgi:UDP-glucose:(heptosyl)LPS alpha-1,3-glucosyltransferase